MRLSKAFLMSFKVFLLSSTSFWFFFLFNFLSMPHWMSDLSSLTRDWTHPSPPHWKYGISSTGPPEKSLILSWNYHLFAYITHLLLHVVHFFVWSLSLFPVSVSKLRIVVILLCLIRPFFSWPLNMTCIFLLQVEHDTLVSVQFSSVAQLFSTLCSYQAPPSIGFSRQEYWSGVPFPSSLHVAVETKNSFLFLK